MLCLPQIDVLPQRTMLCTHCALLRLSHLMCCAICFCAACVAGHGPPKRGASVPAIMPGSRIARRAAWCLSPFRSMAVRTGPCLTMHLALPDCSLPTCSHAIVSSSVGPEYYVSIMSFVDKTQLEPGCSILLHNKVSISALPLGLKDSVSLWSVSCNSCLTVAAALSHLHACTLQLTTAACPA